MPRLPTITAQPVGAPSVSPDAFGAQAGRALAGLGDELERIGQQLQAQQDDTELARLVGEYDAGVQQIGLELQQDADPTTYETRFTEQEAKLRKSLLGSTTRRPVLAVFGQHVAGTLPKRLVEVRSKALELGMAQEVAKIDQLSGTLSRSIASSTDPTQRQQETALFLGIVDRAERRGLYDPVQAQQVRTKFQQSVLQNTMNVLRRTDRHELYRQDRDGAFDALDPDTRLTVLEAARTDDDQEQTRRDQTTKLLTNAIENNWMAQANQGLLSDAALSEALAGQHPYIDAATARQIKAVNDNPVTGTGAHALMALKTEYHLQPSTLEHIEATRQAMWRLQREGGLRGKLFDDFADELQTDQRTMESIEATKINRNIADFKTQYDLNAGKPLLPGIPGTIEKNLQSLDKAEGIRRVQQGEAPKAVADELVKRRQQDVEAIPDRTKAVQELIR